MFGISSLPQSRVGLHRGGESVYQRENEGKTQLILSAKTVTYGVFAVFSVILNEQCPFATHLKQDYDAVKAALSLPWSNGQVEGQIHRLKLIKRQMYGRAHFDLLRKRVLYASG